MQKTVEETIKYFNKNNAHAPVSAIIPCYNSEKTIGRAILSVVNQSWRPAELILVDDASHDKTLEVISDLKGKLRAEWIKVIALSENKGPGNARNIGWDKSSQNYVAFLDADDFWNKDKIAIQMSYMIENDAEISGHKYLLMEEETPQDFSNVQLDEICTKEVRTKKWLFRNYYSVPAVIVKKNLSYRFMVSEIDGYGFEDYFLWLKIALDNHNMVIVDLPLAYGIKRYFGEYGLSGNFWVMEKGEIQIFFYFFENGKINLFFLCASVLWSLLKYLRRVAIFFITRIKTKLAIKE